MIRGSLKGYFSGSSEKGLLDLFRTSPCKIDDVLHRCSDLPNLHVLFSGVHNDAAPEMFASDRMADIFYTLSKRFSPGIVIINSPPILYTSEPTSLATHVDQLVMVVAAGRSNRQQVEVFSVSGIGLQEYRSAVQQSTQVAVAQPRIVLLLRVSFSLRSRPGGRVRAASL